MHWNLYDIWNIYIYIFAMCIVCVCSVGQINKNSTSFFFFQGILKLWNYTAHVCVYFLWDSGDRVQGGAWQCHKNCLCSHHVCPGSHRDRHLLGESQNCEIVKLHGSDHTWCTKGNRNHPNVTGYLGWGQCLMVAMVKCGYIINSNTSRLFTPYSNSIKYIYCKSLQPLCLKLTLM